MFKESSPSTIFGRSVNPIPDGECRLFPPITDTQKVFHLPASLRQIWIVNYYVKRSSDNLSNENKNTGVSSEKIFQKYKIILAF